MAARWNNARILVEFGLQGRNQPAKAHACQSAGIKFQFLIAVSGRGQLPDGTANNRVPAPGGSRGWGSPEQGNIPGDREFSCINSYIVSHRAGLEGQSDCLRRFIPVPRLRRVRPYRPVVPDRHNRRKEELTKHLNRILAASVLLITFTVYWLTLSPTVVFWDVGEYLASAFLLQVPHPPGAPLLLLVGHVFSLIPFSTDPAYRMHLVSALSGAIVATFLYLVSVKVFKRIRGTPESAADLMAVYGSSVIGALSLAFSFSFWNNSIEFEAKGTAMFFVAFILWLAMRWSERAEEPHNEKYLLLIAYLAGLCIGVRPLAVLTIFPVGLIIYVTKYRFERRSFLLAGVVSLLALAAVYPGIVQFLPSLLDGEFQGLHSDLFTFIPYLLIGAAAYGVYRTVRTGQKVLHIACLAFLFVVLGYTTYIGVLMRANVDNLPINENRPNGITGFVSYISREQYGETPLLKGQSWDNEQQAFVEKLFPRRWSQEPMHEPTRVNYTSDADFLWRYQINHMYIRFLLRNFVGPDGYAQDDGVKASGTLAIPFLLGLLGLFYHIKKQWKTGIAFLSAFLLMGVVFALYQNQQDPQPRERDYFYAGSYFVFSLWIGAGVLAIMDLLKKRLSGKRFAGLGTAGVLVLAAAVVPINLLRINWNVHDRSRNYVAWDYSYNLLQSCEADAILFTNGDNDTFPLWYLQSVEGVRRDVRVVNLSLVNTNWYIWELKHEKPYGAKEVALSLTDQQIEKIQPIRWASRVIDVPVPRDIAARYTPPDSSVLKDGKISWLMAGQQYSGDIRYLRVQDIIVENIILNNRWERPIYFAVTCSPDTRIGIDNYLWMEGLSLHLRPVKAPSQDLAIDLKLMKENFLARNVKPSKTPMHGYMFRNLNTPGVYYDDNIQRMVMNYRAGFMRIVDYEQRIIRDNEQAKKALAQMEETLPLDVVPIEDWRYTFYIGRLFHDLGDSVNFNRYAAKVEEGCLEMIAGGKTEQTDASSNPYVVLSEIYGDRKDYSRAIDVLNSLAAMYPNVPWIKGQIDMYNRLRGRGAGAETTGQRR